MKKILASCVVVSALCGAHAFAGSTPETNTLAYQAIQNGQWNEAETILRQGLEQNPNDPMRLLNLAYVLQSTGRANEAASVYQQVLELDRDPLVAVGSDSKVRPARAKILARKGMAALESTEAPESAQR
jgi:tetratricopeptide (TPR) repeat protein